MKAWRSIAPLLALLAAPPAARAAWIGECEAAAPAARILDTVTDPQGVPRHLVVSDRALPGCTMKPLPLASKNILAGRLVSHSTARRLAQGFGLSYEGAADGLAQAEIVPPDEPPTGQAGPQAPGRDATPGPLAAGGGLLAHLSVRAFGPAERVAGSLSGAGITLTCRAGRQTAGLLLSLPYSSLPRETRPALRMRYEADGEFPLGISDERRLAAEDPLIFAGISPASQEAAFPVPKEGGDGTHPRALTILCPSGDAKLRITRLSFESAAQESPSPDRGTWIWNPDDWQNAPDARIGRSIAAGIRTLFITVPVDLAAGRVEAPERLAAFVAAARKAGIAVWAVAGDARAVMAGERGKFVRMARAYSRYNQSVPSESRLAGIQYDIEPYLNRGYGIDAAPWLAAYLATLRELRGATDLPMDLAVPFFWATERTSRGLLLDELAPIADGLTVMVYRTDRTQIQAFAQPFLEWGSRTRRRVRIALEAGPIADSRILHYVPADGGAMALVEESGHGVLLELASPVKAASLRTFQLSHASLQAGSAVSFAARPQALLDLVPDLEKLWSGWPGFSGIALHELLTDPKR